MTQTLHLSRLCLCAPGAPCLRVKGSRWQASFEEMSIQGAPFYPNWAAFTLYISSRQNVETRIFSFGHLTGDFAGGYIKYREWTTCRKIGVQRFVEGGFMCHYEARAWPLRCGREPRTSFEALLGPVFLIWQSWWCRSRKGCCGPPHVGRGL